MFRRLWKKLHRWRRFGIPPTATKAYAKTSDEPSLRATAHWSNQGFLCRRARAEEEQRQRMLEARWRRFGIPPTATDEEAQEIHKAYAEALDVSFGGNGGTKFVVFVMGSKER